MTPPGIAPDADPIRPGRAAASSALPVRADSTLTPGERIAEQEVCGAELLAARPDDSPTRCWRPRELVAEARANVTGEMLVA